MWVWKMSVWGCVKRLFVFVFPFSYILTSMTLHPVIALGRFCVFSHSSVKTAAFFLTTSCSVTGNLEIEWTYRNSELATNMRSHNTSIKSATTGFKTSLWLHFATHKTSWLQASVAQGQTTVSWHPAQGFWLPHHYITHLLFLLWDWWIQKLTSSSLTHLWHISLQGWVGKSSPTHESGITISFVQWQVETFTKLATCIIC